MRLTLWIAFAAFCVTARAGLATDVSAGMRRLKRMHEQLRVKRNPGSILSGFDLDLRQNYFASSEYTSFWGYSYAAKKAMKGSGGYYCSDKNPIPAHGVLYWKIEFLDRRVKIVKIEFDEVYKGAKFKFYSGYFRGRRWVEEVLISGNRADISGVEFENSRFYDRYYLQFTKLGKSNYVSLKNFNFFVRDECGESCSGNGHCEGDIKQSKCICNAGFIGKDCETDINECEGQLCNGNGQCKDGINEYTCICKAGFTGKDCQTDIDECNGQSCSGKGHCKDGINDYTCVCDPGFIGKDCADIDECEGQSCGEKGQCEDGINDYKCICDVGFTGKDCETGFVVAKKLISHKSGPLHLLVNGEQKRAMDCISLGTGAEKKRMRNNGRVACRMLNMKPVKYPGQVPGGVYRWGGEYSGYWRENSKQIYLKHVKCKGDETNLEDCPGWFDMDNSGYCYGGIAPFYIKCKRK